MWEVQRVHPLLCKCVNKASLVLHVDGLKGMFFSELLEFVCHLTSPRDDSLDSGLRGFYTMSSGKWTLTFRKNILLPSSLLASNCRDIFLLYI